MGFSVAERLSSVHETLGCPLSLNTCRRHLSVVHSHLTSLPSTLHVLSKNQEEPCLLSFEEKEMPRVPKRSVPKQHLEERRGLE